MKRAIAVVTIVVLVAACLTGCTCQHENVSQADCEHGAVCEECGVEISAALGHEYVRSGEVIATCTETGKVIYKCKRCGDTYNEDVPKLKHIGEEKVTKQPTLEDYGEKQIVCSICGECITEAMFPLGMYSNPYEIKASTLYSEFRNGKIEKYQDKWLLISGTVQYISDYGDLKGYYLHGTMGNGVACWVDGTKLVCNTGEYAEFLGQLKNIGTDQIELTNCLLQNEVEVKDEPGLKKNDPLYLEIGEISEKYINRWVVFSGTIETTVDYGPAGTWYYLDGDVACLSTEQHSIGDAVKFLGQVVWDSDYWATVVDCVSVD